MVSIKLKSFTDILFELFIIIFGLNIVRLFTGRIEYDIHGNVIREGNVFNMWGTRFASISYGEQMLFFFLRVGFLFFLVFCTIIIAYYLINSAILLTVNVPRVRSYQSLLVILTWFFILLLPLAFYHLIDYVFEVYLNPIQSTHGPMTINMYLVTLYGFFLLFWNIFIPEISLKKS